LFLLSESPEFFEGIAVIWFQYAAFDDDFFLDFTLVITLTIDQQFEIW